MLTMGNSDKTAKSAYIKDTSTREFMVDVIQKSQQQPVLVDFWAPWCGPCRQLTPVIEKVVNEAKGQVLLVKLNIDQHPEIPGQLGIQSIPAVVAFKDGRPVDAFMGAGPESQIRQFIDSLGAAAVPDDAAQAVDMDAILAEANLLLQEGDLTSAQGLYAAILQMDPTHVPALIGLAQAYLTAGEPEQAQGILAQVPAEKQKDPLVVSAYAALELAMAAATLGDLKPLHDRVSQNPADHEARFDLAVGLAAMNKRNEAVDHLIEIIRKDRGFRDDGARKQLVQFFEAWGLSDPASLYGRRRLSSVLFS